MLQCVAVPCSACEAVNCNSLLPGTKCVAVRCNVLQCDAVCGSVLQCVAVSLIARVHTSRVRHGSFVCVFLGVQIANPQVPDSLRAERLP